MISNLTRVQKWTVIAFLIVPLLSSAISTIHIVDFFGLGNYHWMAYVLAAAFEIGSIASAIAITALDKISKWAVWSIFIVLVFFQLIGNIYFSFDYITTMVMSNPEYLDTAKAFIGYFYSFENYDDLRVVLSCLIGLPIPLISLAFLKSVVDYINTIMEESKDNLVEKNKSDILDNNDISENDKNLVDKSSVDVIITDDENTNIDNSENEDIETVVENVDDDTENKITEKESDFIDVYPAGLSKDEIQDLMGKQEYINKNYDRFQKMESDLKQMWPSVTGSKYDPEKKE